jgi:hypothetical protein
MADPKADTKTLPYDPLDPNQNPAYEAPEVIYAEGDHPTENPDGVTNSTDDYWPKTQEEKAEMLGVDMVDPVEVAWDEPYPEGSPPDETEARRILLENAHTPQELVQAEDYEAQHIRNLAAGGSVPPEDVVPGNADV